ncbi:MAG TPA: SoxR reducing system RseC family protein [Bacteroidales bacterium]|nr:SoxR reducing system RseC family protein [Bacteroidales bacterium]
MAEGSEVINHEGVVTSNSGKSVIVSISSQSACSGCHAKGSCNMFGTEQKLIEVIGTYSVEPGDIVNILMERSMGVSALFFGYILPFFVLLISLVTSISFNLPELTAGLISFGMLMPYYLILYFFRKRLSEKFTFTLKSR